MTDVNVGTPDWQRSVVGAQKLIGSFAANQNEPTLGIPINAESLWIFQPGVPGTGLAVSVEGITTGTLYPAYQLPPSGSVAQASFFCPISAVLDPQVVIAWEDSPSEPWYVVSDASGRFVMDGGLASVIGSDNGPVPDNAVLIAGNDTLKMVPIEVDANGRLVPLVPTATTGFTNMTTAGTAYQVLATPSSGAWYLFDGYLQETVAGAINGVYLNATGIEIPLQIADAPTTKSFVNNGSHCPLHGLRCTSAVTLTPQNNDAALYGGVSYAAGP